MKMDPNEDISIVKSALCLLESLFLSDKNSDDDDDDEEGEMGSDNEDEEN